MLTESRVLRRVIALLLVYIQTLLASAKNDARNEIPIETSSRFGLLLVKAEVDGKPAVLIVDTGSTITVISTKLATISEHHSNRVMVPRNGSGLVGMGVYAQAAIKVGPLVWGKRRIVVMDMQEVSNSLEQEVDGILGLDFFSQVAFFAVDTKNHKLILRAH
jgi:predicted aspartyl protease